MEGQRWIGRSRSLVALVLAPLSIAFFWAGSAVAAEEQVIDGGFETVSPSWTFAEGEQRCQESAPTCGLAAATGSFYAATLYPNEVPPAAGLYAVGSVSQALGIPASPATLSFKLRQLQTGELPNELVVEYAGEKLAEISNGSSEFSTVSIPIPATLIGPAVRPLTFKTLCFSSTVSTGHCDRFDIDDVSLVAGPEAAPPGGGPGPGAGGQTPTDTKAPDTTIAAGKRTAHVGSRHARATVGIRFSSEPGARFECRLDGKPFGPCASPAKLRLKLGKHVFLVRAVDQAGNADSTPARATIKVKLSG